MAELFVQQQPRSYQYQQPQQQSSSKKSGMSSLPSSSMFSGDSSLFGGGSSSSAGSSATSSLGSVAPWAALAAAIIGNESEQKKAGRRPDDNYKHLQDALTGKVLADDMDYYGDKVGGIGGEIIKVGGQFGSPEGIFDFIKDLF